MRVGVVGRRVGGLEIWGAGTGSHYVGCCVCCIIVADLGGAARRMRWEVGGGGVGWVWVPFPTLWCFLDVFGVRGGFTAMLGRSVERGVVNGCRSRLSPFHYY